MSRRVIPVLLTLAACVALSCDRPTGPSLGPTEVEAPPPQFAIVDAVHQGGNPYFFFMSPLVADVPSGGTFDATRLGSLAVDVCELGAAGCAAAPIKHFVSSSGMTLERIRLDPVRKYYLVYWNTGEAIVDPAKNYRIRVSAGSTLLGLIDVDVAASTAELNAVNRSQFAGVMKGDWLPIRFRIDQGALTYNTPPVVTIASPASATHFKAGSSITFTGSASDAQDGDLTAGIQWKDGATLLGTGASVSAALAAGPHTVAASVADSKGAAGQATVDVVVDANQAPTATITAPATGTSVNQGAVVTFTGSANDPEDGALSGASLAWTSDKDGAIGTGTTVSKSNLSVGMHTITLTATDGQGATGTATITLTITHLNNPPTASISAPADASSVNEGAVVTFTGSATDAEDGALTGASLTWTSDKDGAIGTGASFTKNNLTAGVHHVTLTATDSQGATGTAAITLTVTPNHPPTATITAPAAGLSYPYGTVIAFTGAGSDIEDGALSGAALTWSSNLDGAVGSGSPLNLSTLRVGTHTITLTATDSRGGTGTASVTVIITSVQITVPATLNVPYGQNVSIVVQIPQAAPAGGTTITLTTSDASHVSVSTPTITIPGGSNAANGTLHGVAPGPATITASNPAYAPGTSVVTTTANLDITQSSLTLGPTTPTTMTIQLESSGTPIAAPGGGISIALTSSNAACARPQTTPITLGAGLVNVTTTIEYGGSAATPCTARIKASATDIVPDSVNATVSSLSLSFSGSSIYVGSGLQHSRSTISLGVPAPAGGVTVHLQADDTLLLKVSPSSSTAGSGGLDLAIAAGGTDAYFWAQGMEGRTGTTQLRASAPGYAQGSITVTVVQPGFDLISLPTVATTLTNNIAFAVRTGVPYATNPNAILTEQELRAGGPGVTVTIDNSAAGVAQLVIFGPVNGQSGTVDIPPGDSRSPTGGAANHGIEFDPLGVGTTTVSGTAPGWHPFSGGTQTVKVSAPKLTFNSTVYVGTGLQHGTFYVTLGAAAPAGGVTVHLVPDDTLLLKLAPDNATAGTGTLDVPVTAGNAMAQFWVQGMEGHAGSTKIRASAPGYAADSTSATVMQPGLELISLPAALTTLSPNKDFQVRVGIPFTSNPDAIWTEQSVRAGGSTVTVTVTNLAAGVGELVTFGPVSAQTATVDIAPGQARSPTGGAAGHGIEFHPLGAGSTTVAGTSPGYHPFGGGTQVVKVSAPALTFNAVPSVGTGLQYGPYHVALGVVAPTGGVTVHLVPDDAGLLLLAPNNATAGTATLDVLVSAGNNAAVFWVHGVEGRTGATKIRATAPAYAADSVTANVVQPGFELLSLPAATTTLSPNSAFRVRIGIATPSSPNDLWVEQGIRIGGSQLTATVNSTNGTTGRLLAPSQSGASVTTTIVVGQAQSPSGGVAGGGLEFKPMGIGTTTVSATIPGLVQFVGGSKLVTVSAPNLTFASAPAVGSGLQDGPYTLNLQAPAPAGGVTVHLASSAPGVMVLAPDGATAGKDTVDFAVPGGGTSASFWVQGIEGQTGTVTITATAPGYNDGTTAAYVYVPVIEMSSGPSNTSAGAANQSFQVRVGIGASGATTSMHVEQPIRAGGNPLVITISNLNAAVAQLVTFGPVTGQSATLTLGVRQSKTPAGGAASHGIEFDPLAAGSTTVTVGAPGFTPTNAGVKNITVGP